MTGPDHELLRMLRATTPGALQAAFDHAPVMVTVTEGPQHLLVWRNRMAVELYGPAVTGRPLVEEFPDAAGAMEMWDRAFGGEPVEQGRRLVGPPDREGRRRVLRYSMAPLRGGSGSVLGVVQFVCDVTEEADAERAAAHGRLLAYISDELSRAGDALSALQALAAALVPDMADLAAVYAYPGGRGRADEPTPPVALAMSASLSQVGPPPAPVRREGQSRWEEMLRDGRAVSVPLDDETVGQIAPSPQARAWLDAADGRHLAVVPLMVAGEMAGGVLLLATAGRPGYDDTDLDFLREVTTAAGAAITEVRARERHRLIAERLQRALLPRTPDQPPGMVVAARYVAGGAGTAVGGDWWDVLDMGRGRVGLGIGDISGHGIGAAALMGQARVAMRTAGHALLSPARVLTAVDARLVEAIDQQWDDDGPDMHRFATALYALVDLENANMIMASAGHLPILLKPADGPIRTVWAPSGPPLGLGIGGYQELEVPFCPGDVALAFTDGLVEDRSCSVTDGIDKLGAALGDCAPGTSLELVADLLLGQMVPAERSHDDDIAVLLFGLR